ncbi:MAG TPA: class I SAM-dependent methyltransferase, partial [Desulfatiglandales bacterium]|nr:class I SAM-dependent methyltransferase [Desulfatiglandales bacterium]
MVIKIFKERLPDDFTDHTALPKSNKQGRNWQELNKSWWEKNPNRYDFDFKGRNPHKEFTNEFYEEIDKRFFQSVWQFMPWQKLPFDSLIDFESLGKKDVLEIGVGCGSHAQLLAKGARSYTGIDITNYAIKCTQARFNCFGCNGNILLMDAEKMEFQDNTFDFIWSWGVMHHSSNTQRILKEIYRVLRPGGEAVTMVYHRSIWNTYIRGALYYGILRGGLIKQRSLAKVIQESTDGALARYYTVTEWEELLSAFFKVKKIFVFGSKSQIVPLPYCRTK